MTVPRSFTAPGNSPKGNNHVHNPVYRSGLPALQNAAAHALKTAELNPNDGILYTERQRADVQEALTALEEAENALLMGMTWDAVTVSLEGAIAALNELTGERVSDAVVDQVFEKFCVGK